MKTCRGVEVQIHVFLTSALDGGEWSALLPWKEPAVLYPLYRGWVCPSVGLDDVLQPGIESRPSNP
jgi:hypothetical protein